MNLVESMEEEPVPEQEGASVGGQSPGDENRAVLEETVGEIGTEEEDEGAVTVLKLSNGVMLRVPVEVQGMQLQAVVDTAAQVTLCLRSSTNCWTLPRQLVGKWL